MEGEINVTETLEERIIKHIRATHALPETFDGVTANELQVEINKLIEKKKITKTNATMITTDLPKGKHYIEKLEFSAKSQRDIDFWIVN